jgi:hypothetical protein
MSLRKYAWHILFFTLVFAGSCTVDDPGPGGQPVVTEVGTPTGTAVSASIGAAGGKLTSADGLVTLDIPAGALDAATTISIQPITNMAPQGIAGVAYRFTPDGQTFKTPAKLTFKYTDAMLAGSSAELFWVVTQAQDGSWQAVKKSSVNTTTKTVTGEMMHFSDWGLGKFIDLSLDPPSSVVKPDQSVNLSVAGFIASTDPNADLAPLVPLGKSAGNDDLIPLSRVPFETANSTYKLVKWTLSGEGTLSPNGWNATYTAPSKVPSKNPVTVTIEMQRYENGAPAANFSKVLLVANITISEVGILVINFNGTEYRFKQTGGPEVAVVVVDNEYMVWQGASGSGIPNFTFYRALKATGSHTHRCEEAADEVAYTASASPSGIYVKEWYDDEGRLYCATFTSNITEFGSKFGESIVGSFSGNLYNNKGQLFPISGYFNLTRIN